MITVCEHLSLTFTFACAHHKYCDQQAYTQPHALSPLC
ncbi:hypothetical protein SC09_Contig28orf00019 [Bacillus subtilis]|uniref:Uncharacterized protein n=1 Tax=Bacillus subtilis TaxID=1423 RepID=A0A0D1L2V5_BACIU|nr:hypothetical protein SC09_Contig28orf00019 [Bacillus subtilis]